MLGTWRQQHLPEIVANRANRPGTRQCAASSPISCDTDSASLIMRSTMRCGCPRSTAAPTLCSARWCSSSSAICAGSGRTFLPGCRTICPSGNVRHAAASSEWPLGRNGGLRRIRPQAHPRRIGLCCRGGTRPRGDARPATAAAATRSATPPAPTLLTRSICWPCPKPERSASHLGDCRPPPPGQILFGVGPAALKVTLAQAGERIAQRQRCLPKSLSPDGEEPRAPNGRRLRSIFSSCAPSSGYRSLPTSIGMAPNIPLKNRPGKSAIRPVLPMFGSGTASPGNINASAATWSKPMRS